MGLPLFVAPVEPQVASKAAEKPTAAPRSAIRRHRTLRGHIARPHVADTRRRRILSMVADTTPEEYEIWEMQRASPPNDGESASERAHRLFQTRYRDTLSFERQTPRATNSEVDGPLMPPVPESRDYSAIEDHQQRMRQIRPRLATRRNLAPTPQYTEANLASLLRMPSDSPPLPLSPGSQQPRYDAEFTARRSDPDTAAAVSSRRPHRPTLSDVSTINPRLSEATYSPAFCINRVINTGTGLPPESSLSERVHAINRSSMNQRRVARQAALLDGLGDRDRSLSPEGPTGAAWDTLLSSIPPDPQPPSAGSSFASAPSAIAAASSSSDSAPASASTSMTSMGPSEETPVVHDCDMSDSGSTSDEEDEDLLAEFGRNRAARAWRSYADVVTARADQARAVEEPDLDSMHLIISRLAHSDDIPDEFWVSAGLSRNLRREPTTL
ncbi:hypothetical protein LAWI1_G008059 [Lachnellula willkommii]|uniref:Uncharacterized protein n=1 Tax=Lachnellula willkommii TaxID=215461 RepID=A0A559LZQ8_9HELO|nr:hypothetical protein LAWI1_G008059 [Lachnellula willkommii]